jgi:hypothetical protein
MDITHTFLKSLTALWCFVPVSRSVWAEQRAAAQWEQRHQDYVEKVYSDVKVELHQKENRQRHLKSHYHIPSAQELALICSGDKLCQILESAPDPASVEVLFIVIFFIVTESEIVKYLTVFHFP